MAELTGLTEAEVLERRARGQTNAFPLATSRSYADIFRQNVFNFINIILFLIGIALVSLNRIGDAVLSVGLITLNVIIGVIQEIRAKRQLDQIALLTRPRAHVLRDGVEREVDPAEIVIDDLLIAKPGDQIVVDGVVVGPGKMDVDESLLTGESDLIPKQEGDQVMSGSFCVNGTAHYRAVRVGAEAFANKLTSSARQFRVVKTPLQRDVDFILRLLALLALFMGLMLLISAVLYALPLVRSVQMASVIAGLIPNGLFFMVIVSYAMGALRIANQGALIQQSNSVESISNVTVLCMDKTGTLTANKIVYTEAIPLNGFTRADVERMLGDYAASVTAANKTSEALRAALPGTKQPLADEVPFSSALKWSAIALADDGVFVLGALEMLVDHLPAEQRDDLRAQVRAYSERGLRVLLFARQTGASGLHDAGGHPLLPAELTPVAIVILSDELRPNVQDTIANFARAGVQLKVISGDNPDTVAALAIQAGFPKDVRAISGPELDKLDDAAFDAAARECTIFGRITPQQKERLVESLRRQGHYVAMMGDGVNDVLSLKKAHVGIAMQSGSAATRGVADMILLNDSFAALPPAFIEGQRILNGMQDILRLFLARGLTVALLIIATAMIGMGFPFVPKHNAVISFFAVGMPTLALALWARPDRIRGRMLASVIHFVVPAAIVTFLFGLFIYVLFFILGVFENQFDVLTEAEINHYQTYLGLDEPPTQEEIVVEAAAIIARTALTTFTVFAGLMLVVFVEPPIPFFVGGDTLSPDKRPTYLAIAMGIVFVIGMLIAPVRNFLELVPLRPAEYLVIAGTWLLWMLTLRAAWRGRWLQRFLLIDTPDAVSMSQRERASGDAFRPVSAPGPAA